MANDDTAAGPIGKGPFAGRETEAIAGRYHVVRWLGGGGMGNVYEAIDTELGEPVALKVLGGGLTEDAIERFRREVRLTRRIRHHNVARMFDIGEHRGSRFLTMELVDGAALSRELGAPLPWARLQPIAQQVCAGLAAAHAEGVIHRDLKPDNVILERTTGRAVVTDFGIARSPDDVAVTQIGEVIGTPRYMAPEQLAGDAADERSDLFSLGVMLFELATATRPWQGKTAAAIALERAARARRPFAGSDCPPAFAELVERCLALHRSDRPATAEEVERAIAACEIGGATQFDVRAASPDGPPEVRTLATEQATRREVPLSRPRPADPEPPRAPARSSSSELQPASPLGPATTLAVMPFTAAEADIYLTDGMVEDLIDTLSTTSQLRVRPVGASGRNEPDPRELGRRLGVDQVVSGSVRRIPTGLRIAARLTSVVDGFQIWARRTDVVDAEVLSLADQLAREIATALSTRATAHERPTDPRAVELYLRARAELRHYWGVYVAAAADLFEQALTFAPTSPPILGAFAFAAAQAWLMHGGTGAADRARTAIERALPTGHGDAHLASAVFRMNQADPEGAAEELANALARAPMSSHAHEYAGRTLIELELTSEARFHFDSAALLDPARAAVVVVELARIDALEGNWDAAFARIAPLSNHPDLPTAQFVAMYETRLHGWRRDLTSMKASSLHFALRTNENSTEAVTFVVSSLRSGNIDRAHWERLMNLYADPTRPRRASILGLQIVAETSSLHHEPDLALASLAAAADAGLSDVVWIDRCPLLDGLDPVRFTPIRAQVAARAARVLARFRTASTAR
ncbi:MAG: protein kinase [Myxococcales bacterium]|nr:protein kinase [Myxococcales bacterium]